MGWVSILEDAIDRLNEDLHALQGSMPHGPESVPFEQWKSAVGLIARGEAILAEAAKYLDMATDPSIELAKALESTVDEARELKRKVSEFQQTCFSLMARLREREEDVRVLRDQLKALKVANNALEGKLEDAMRSNPAGVYDAFSSKAKGK